MRRLTLAVLLALVVALAGMGAVAAVWGTFGGTATLSEVWVSDTARSTDFNHHGAGANDGVVVAPVLEQGAPSDLTNQSCTLVRLDPADGSVEWRRGVAPADCFVHSLTKPAVTDLDGDGVEEVVTGTIRNETVVLDARDASERAAVPHRAYSYGQPTVADVDADGRPDIVASDISGDVAVADANGTVRWRGNVSGLVYDSPLVADLDGDGATEVVVGSRDETVAYDRDGTVLWRRQVSGSDVEAADTGDGAVVVAVGHDGVVAFDAATGDRRWNDSAPGTASLESVGDVDGDGRREAFVSVAGNLVRAYEVGDGSLDWETRLATADDVVTPPPVLADLSGDGEAELVAPTNGGTVVVLDPVGGEELAAYEREVPIWTAATAADITDSPGDEILVTYGDGRIVALAYEN